MNDSFEDDDNTSTIKSTTTLIPRTSPHHRLSLGESDDGTLTNMSQDGLLNSHYGLKRQLSESSYSSDTSRTTVKSNHRHSVTFEDDINLGNVGRDDSKFKTPSDTSNNSSPYRDTPVAPPRRHKLNGGPSAPDRPSPQQTQTVIERPPQRPKTLDLGSSKQGILKSSSASHSSSMESSHESPRSSWVTPSESGDHTPYFSTRSRMSPGNTPPHILHQKTLLDIDMEGQVSDPTKPLLEPKILRSTSLQIEFEFNERL